jgi:excisionase family DNA binding protein
MKATERQSQSMPRCFYRIPEAAEILGLGRSKTYELVQSGALRTVRVGRAVRVPASAIQAFAERLEAEGAHV